MFYRIERYDRVSTSLFYFTGYNQVTQQLRTIGARELRYGIYARATLLQLRVVRVFLRRALYRAYCVMRARVLTTFYCRRQGTKKRRAPGLAGFTCLCPCLSGAESFHYFIFGCGSSSTSFCRCRPLPGFKSSSSRGSAGKTISKPFSFCLLTYAVFAGFAEQSIFPRYAFGVPLYYAYFVVAQSWDAGDVLQLSKDSFCL